MKNNKLEKLIVDIIGKNSTGTGLIANDNIEFKEIHLSDGTQVSESYTYNSEVIIINNTFEEIEFNSYNEKDQELIYNSIINNK